MGHRAHAQSLDGVRLDCPYTGNPSQLNPWETAWSHLQRLHRPLGRVCYIFLLCPSSCCRCRCTSATRRRCRRRACPRSPCPRCCRRCTARAPSRAAARLLPAAHVAACSAAGGRLPKVLAPAVQQSLSELQTCRADKLAAGPQHSRKLNRHKLTAGLGGRRWRRRSAACPSGATPSRTPSSPPRPAKHSVKLSVSARIGAKQREVHP